jgi:hypothetical protein
MPEQTPIPIPLGRWFNDAKKIEELREIMASETFQTALATLKEVAGPSYSSIAEGSETNSQRFAWYAGYRDAFADLHKLTKLDTTNQQQPVIAEEWTHITNPQ